MRDPHTGTPRGFGFVAFSTLEAANSSIGKDHLIDHKAVEVKRSEPMGPRRTQGGGKGKGGKGGGWNDHGKGGGGQYPDPYG